MFAEWHGQVQVVRKWRHRIQLMAASGSASIECSEEYAAAAQDAAAKSPGEEATPAHWPVRAAFRTPSQRRSRSRSSSREPSPWHAVDAAKTMADTELDHPADVARGRRRSRESVKLSPMPPVEEASRGEYPVPVSLMGEITGGDQSSNAGLARPVSALRGRRASRSPGRSVSFSPAPEIVDIVACHSPERGLLDATALAAEIFDEAMTQAAEPSAEATRGRRRSSPSSRGRHKSRDQSPASPVARVGAGQSTASAATASEDGIRPEPALTPPVGGSSAGKGSPGLSLIAESGSIGGGHMEMFMGIQVASGGVISTTFEGKSSEAVGNLAAQASRGSSFRNVGGAGALQGQQMNAQRNAEAIEDVHDGQVSIESDTGSSPSRPSSSPPLVQLAWWESLGSWFQPADYWDQPRGGNSKATEVRPSPALPQESASLVSKSSPNQLKDPGDGGYWLPGFNLWARPQEGAASIASPPARRVEPSVFGLYWGCSQVFPVKSAAAPASHSATNAEVRTGGEDGASRKTNNAIAGLFGDAASLQFRASTAVPARREAANLDYWGQPRGGDSIAQT